MGRNLMYLVDVQNLTVINDTFINATTNAIRAERANATFINIQILNASSTAFGVNATTSSNLTFKNSTFNSTPTSGVDFAVNNSLVVLENTSFTRSSYVLYTATSNISVKWHQLVRVVTTSGSGISGATVSVFNSSGSSLSSGTTDASGYFQSGLIYEVLITLSANFFSTPPLI